MTSDNGFQMLLPHIMFAQFSCISNLNITTRIHGAVVRHDHKSAMNCHPMNYREGDFHADPQNKSKRNTSAESTHGKLSCSKCQAKQLESSRSGLEERMMSYPKRGRKCGYTDRSNHQHASLSKHKYWNAPKPFVYQTKLAERGNIFKFQKLHWVAFACTICSTRKA